MSNFYHRLLFKRMGWSEQVSIPHRDKCIICVAPHTSNWDFIIGKLYYRSLGRTAGFLMKKEWFFWPLGILFRKMGGIPVYRSKKTSMTDTLAERIKEMERFELAVTPEGTRSKVTTWKRGFYFIALKAGIPIQLYDLDYKNKVIRCTKELMPTGDVEADMREIMEYYKNSNAKYPEKFAIEEI
jgi:1-acyl-sn-glycerol-3-phosphate acyltransferase